MIPGKDYYPYDENKLMQRSALGAYTRFKEPGELTQQEAMTIFVLEQELAKDAKENHLNDFQKGKLREELVKLREKERFKENKEAAQNIQIGDGFKKISNEKKEIQQIEKELLDQNTPNQTKKQRLQELREKEVPIDGEQFKVLVKDITEQVRHPQLKKFVEEFCIFDLNDDIQGDIMVDPYALTGKFQLSLKPEAFYDKSETRVIDQFGIERHIKFFNPGKAAFLIGQALGHILEEPQNWKNVAPQIKITAGGEIGSWEDFVGLCISNPDKAEKLSPEAYKHYRKVLDGLGDKKINLKKEKKSFNNPKFEADLRSDKEKTTGSSEQGAPSRGFVMNFIKKFGFGSIDKEERAINWSEFKKTLWKKTDWAQRAVAEIESKETSNIVNRQENIADRDKSLRQLVTDGSHNIGWEDCLRLRSILLADMETEDFSNERIHIYLQASDYKYRATQGEQITEDSYNFVVRLHRNSNKKGRKGTKPPEYCKVEIGEVYSEYKSGIYIDKVATSEVYVRKSRHKLMDDVLGEVNTFSGREISNVSKEFLEYLKIGDKLIDIDETWGKEQGERGSDNKYKCATGNWKNIVGDEFADKMFDNYNNRGDIPKLNPDQIAIIARVIAEELKGTKEWTDAVGGKEIQSIIYREHAKGALVEAYNYYKPIFLENPTYREYVNYFLKVSGAQVNERGQISRIESNNNGDEKQLSNFIGSEKNGKNHDYDYDDAHNILDKYNDLEQEEKPAWEEDAQGKTKDASANKLKREFIEKRNEREAAQDVEKLEKVMEKYIVKIIKEINKADLPAEIRKSICMRALVSNDTFILNDVKDDISKYDTALLSPDEVYKTNQDIQETVLNLRPYRRELIDIKKLLGALGLEFLGSKALKDSPDYDEDYMVKIAYERNFQTNSDRDDRYKQPIKQKREIIEKRRMTDLDDEEKTKYLELKSKLDQINKDIDEIKEDPSDEDKKKLKGLRKNLGDTQKEIKPYIDKIGTTSEKGVLVELQQDVQDILTNLNTVIENVDSYLEAIDNANDDENTQKNKNIFSLIPSGICKEAKNPTTGKYDTGRITMALKYIGMLIERKVNDIDTKAAVSSQPKKEKKPKSTQPVDDSD